MDAVGAGHVTGEGRNGDAELQECLALQLRMLVDVAVKRSLVANDGGAGARHDHRLGLSVEKRGHVLQKVRNDEVGLLRHVRRMKRLPLGKSTAGGMAVHSGALLLFAGKLIGRLVGGIALKNVKNEALLNRLTH